MSARVCVIGAVRSVRPFIPWYRQSIERFTIAPVRVVLHENNSRDGTAAALRAWSGVTYWSTRSLVPHFPKVATAERAAHLALVRNQAIAHALIYDDWDVALMLDVQKFLSPGGLEKLLEVDGDIVAPLIAIPGGCFYDTWCFRHLDGTAFREIADGRPHLALDAPAPFEVQAVGGVYTIRRAVLEAGHRLAGTDGTACDSVPLCVHARAAGYSVWVHPQVQAIHAPSATQYRWYVQQPELLW